MGLTINERFNLIGAKAKAPVTALIDNLKLAKKKQLPQQKQAMERADRSLSKMKSFKAIVEETRLATSDTKATLRATRARWIATSPEEKAEAKAKAKADKLQAKAKAKADKLQAKAKAKADKLKTDAEFKKDTTRTSSPILPRTKRLLLQAQEIIAQRKILYNLNILDQVLNPGSMTTHPIHRPEGHGGA